jgi:hypothetical protein
MTEDILQRPITFVVKVSRTRTEVALIPVIAMTAEEAQAKAWARRAERSHEWRLMNTKEECHGIVDTRGFANEFQTEMYIRHEKRRKEAE